MSELPRGWMYVLLGDVTEISSGYGFPKNQQGKTDGDFPFAKVRDISAAVLKEQGRLKTADNFVDAADLYSLRARPVPEGSTVFAKIGEALKLNRRAIATRSVILDNNCMAITPYEGVLDCFYLFRFMGTVDLSPFAVATAVPSVRRGDVANIRLPLPPLAEQKRMIAKLDSLFARTCKAHKELARIPILIEHYKQAVLAAAFRGDLTAGWRTKACSPSPKGQSDRIDGRLTALPALPESWAWTNIGAIGDVSGGLTKNQKRNELPRKVPYLRVANVYANELRLNDIQEIGITDKEWERVRLEKGDLLIVEGNGSIDQIGRVAVWQGEIDQCAHQNHLIKVRSRDDIEPKYLLYWLLSPLGRQTIERVASSSSGLHTLSLSKISGLPFPLCTNEEMQQIISKIEGVLAVLGNVGDETTKGTDLIDNLERAALEKAFQGKLVPQDPNDEPADMLLERIRVKSKAAMKVSNRTRQRSDKIKTDADGMSFN